MATDLFDDIVSELSEDDAKSVKPKRGRGRPKSKKTVAAEQEAFVKNYESKRAHRPEPVRLIKCLALPEEEQRQAIEDVLTPRQRAFCKEYVIDFNATQAAIRAGYGVTNAQNSAYQLMQYRSVMKLIGFYTESTASKITTVDKDYIIQKITEIVSGDAKDSDKLRGLELLARHLGMFVDRTEITGKDGEAIKIEETKREAFEVAQQLRRMATKPAPLSIIDGGKSDKTGTDD